MIEAGKIKRLKKDEIIEEYEKLIEKYKNLRNDYDDVVVSNDKLFAQNLELKDEIDYENEEIEEQAVENYIEPILKDIKFGTDLQGIILDTVFKFAEDYGFRFNMLDLPMTAKEVSESLKSNLKLSNKIADILVLHLWGD